MKTLSQSPVGGRPLPRTAAPTPARPAAAPLLQRASAEPAQALPAALSQRLSQQVAADFSSVRVHSGPASHAAALRLGASAYTVGRHVHLSDEAQGLTGRARSELLAHEAVHSAQQGHAGNAFDGPSGGLTLGRAGDASEREAEDLAAACVQADPGQDLEPGQGHLPRPLQQRHGPRIQRHLRGPYKSLDGQFDLDLRTVSDPGGTSGMMGLISFTAAPDALDAKRIRLLQTAKVTAGAAGLDLVWSGQDADRNLTQTRADAPAGVQGGFFVDHDPAQANPRQAATDAPVSPYYNDYYNTKKVSRDGSKKGAQVQPAVLADFPGSSGERVFRFETAALSDYGYVYASLEWGFTISDAAKGQVTGEHASVTLMASRTFDAAVKAFDEFYANPNASSAPQAAAAGAPP